MAQLVLCLLTQGPKQGFGRAAFLSEGSEDNFTSKRFQVAGRIQFHAVLRLRSPFPCWLLAGAILSFWRPPTFCGLWPTHSVFKASNSRLSPSHFSNLFHFPSSLFLLCFQPEMFLHLLGFMRLVWGHQITQGDLSISRSIIIIISAKSFLSHNTTLPQLWGLGCGMSLEGHHYAFHATFHYP